MTVSLHLECCFVLLGDPWRYLIKRGKLFWTWCNTQDYGSNNVFLPETNKKLEHISSLDLCVHQESFLLSAFFQLCPFGHTQLSEFLERIFGALYRGPIHVTKSMITHLVPMLRRQFGLESLDAFLQMDFSTSSMCSIKSGVRLARILSAPNKTTVLFCLATKFFKLFYYILGGANFSIMIFALVSCNFHLLLLCS